MNQVRLLSTQLICVERSERKIIFGKIYKKGKAKEEKKIKKGKWKTNQ